MARLNGIYDSHISDGQGFLGQIDERLRAIRSAGLELVLNYGTGGGDAAANLAYADRAYAAGLRVIWNPWRSANQWGGDWIDAVKGHPATWGFYVGDEAQPGSVEDLAVRSLSKFIRLHTKKPTLYVSRPGRKALRPFLGVASHVGPDCYPVGKPASWAKPDPQRIGDVAAWAREMVNEPGGAGKLAFVCQAFSWSVDYPQESLPWPTPEQMAAMKRAVIRRGNPDLLLWFCLHCITDYHPDPELYWRSFAAVA